MALRDGGLTTGGGSSVGAYPGSFGASATGSLVISGIPFEPSKVTFRAAPAIRTTDSDGGNPSPDYAGSSEGFARNDDGTIVQQTVHDGGSGNSINDVGFYSSTSYCLAVRYADQNGDLLGYVEIQMTDFKEDGFELTVDTSYRDLIVHYTAYA